MSMHTSGETNDDLIRSLHLSTTLSANTDFEPEHTQTGIPVKFIWLPYLGLTLVLVVLVAFSFWQYHRKHGHKYHNAQNVLPTTVTPSNQTSERPNSTHARDVSCE